MTTQVANGDSLNTELKSTELGSFISNNKGLVIGLIALIVAGLAAFSIMSYSKSKSNEEAATAMYTFESTTLKSYQEGKTDTTAMKNELLSLVDAHSGTGAAFSTALLAVDYMTNKKEFAQAKELLTALSASNSLQAYFIDIRLATVNEELGDHKGAVEVLNRLLTNDNKLTLGKVELDLARNYYYAGDKDNAKVHFEKVIETNTQSFYKTLAKDFLQKIN